MKKKPVKLIIQEITSIIGPLLAGFQVAIYIVSFFGIGALASWIIEYWFPFTRALWAALLDILYLPDLSNAEKDALTTVLFFLPLGTWSLLTNKRRTLIKLLKIDYESFLLEKDKSIKTPLLRRSAQDVEVISINSINRLIHYSNWSSLDRRRLRGFLSDYGMNLSDNLVNIRDIPDPRYSSSQIIFGLLFGMLFLAVLGRQFISDISYFFKVGHYPFISAGYEFSFFLKSISYCALMIEYIILLYYCMRGFFAKDHVFIDGQRMMTDKIIPPSMLDFYTGNYVHRSQKGHSRHSDGKPSSAVLITVFLLRLALVACCGFIAFNSIIGIFDIGVIRAIAMFITALFCTIAILLTPQRMIFAFGAMLAFVTSSIAFELLLIAIDGIESVQRPNT